MAGTVPTRFTEKKTEAQRGFSKVDRMTMKNLENLTAELKTPSGSLCYMRELKYVSASLK